MDNAIYKEMIALAKGDRTAERFLHAGFVSGVSMAAEIVGQIMAENSGDPAAILTALEKLIALGKQAAHYGIEMENNR